MPMSMRYETVCTRTTYMPIEVKKKTRTQPQKSGVAMARLMVQGTASASAAWRASTRGSPTAKRRHGTVKSCTTAVTSTQAPSTR